MATNPTALLSLLDLIGKPPQPVNPGLQFYPGTGLPMPPVLNLYPPGMQPPQQGKPAGSSGSQAKPPARNQPPSQQQAGSPFSFPPAWTPDPVTMPNGTMLDPRFGVDSSITFGGEVPPGGFDVNSNFDPNGSATFLDPNSLYPSDVPIDPNLPMQNDPNGVYGNVYGGDASAYYPGDSAMNNGIGGGGGLDYASGGYDYFGGAGGGAGDDAQFYDE